MEAGEVEPRPGHALIGTPARLLALRANRHAGFAGAKAARRAMAAPAHPCARGIPFILNIKSSGSSTTWVDPSLKGCLYW
jgi:hypothetical protein